MNGSQDSFSRLPRLTQARWPQTVLFLLAAGAASGCSNAKFEGVSAKNVTASPGDSGGPGGSGNGTGPGRNAGGSPGPNSGATANSPPGQECKTYPSQGICVLDTSCTWSSSRSDCESNPSLNGGAGQECTNYTAKAACAADQSCAWSDAGAQCGSVAPLGSTGGGGGNGGNGSGNGGPGNGASGLGGSSGNGGGSGGSGNGDSGGGIGNGGNLGVAGGMNGNPDIAVDGGSFKTPNIRIGMLVSDLNCTFCHLEVHGDVGSVTSVAPFRSDSHGQVFGRWLVNGAFNAAANLTAPPKDEGIQITGTALTAYDNSGHELPVDANGKPTFPVIEFGALASRVQGGVQCTDQGCGTPQVTKVYNGNLTLIGRADQPIMLQGDILVQGDLVITGVYSGVGTIYATGNIYVPANLTAANKASFPYPDPANGDYSAADAAAKVDIQAGKDALGLASQHGIFIGDLENYMDSTNGPTGLTGIGGATEYVSLYDYTDQIAGRSGGGAGSLLAPRANSGVEGVYAWLPEAQYQELYQSVTPCWTTSNRPLVNGRHWGDRAVNEIDAFLYAADAIGGVSRATNWTINGGMIAQSMHFISGAGYDSIGATSCAPSRINFDYRMRNRLPLLGALAPFFPGS